MFPQVVVEFSGTKCKAGNNRDRTSRAPAPWELPVLASNTANSRLDAPSRLDGVRQWSLPAIVVGQRKLGCLRAASFFMAGTAIWIIENLTIYKSVSGMGGSIGIGRKMGSRCHSDVDCYERAALQPHDAFDPGGDISERRADRENQGNIPTHKVKSQVRFLHIRLLKDLHFGSQNFVDDRIAAGARR